MVLLKCLPHFLDLPQGQESEDSEQFFKKVLGPTEGSSVSGVLQPSIKHEGEPNQSGLPQRNLSGMPGIFPYVLTFSFICINLKLPLI